MKCSRCGRNVTKSTTTYVSDLGDVLVVVLIGCPILYSIQKKGKKIWDKKVFISSMLFVIPLIPHYLSQRVLSQLDRIMISQMIGEKQAGIYSLAYSVGMLLMLLNSAIDSAISPWVFRNLRYKKYSKIVKISQKLILFYALCVECFIMITPELVNLFATKEYRDAMFIVPIIAISSYFIFVYVQFVYFEYFIGKTKAVGIVTGVSAGVNIILNFFMIKEFGYKAAAYTTLFCYAMYALGHFHIMKYLSKKYLNINRIYNGYYLFIVSGVLIVMGLLSIKVYSYTYMRIFIFSVCFLVTFFYGVTILSRYKKYN